VESALADPLVGAVLEGRYRVQRMVARGGMATVYAAQDERLRRMVAVKILHPQFAADPRFVERFAAEAHSIARMSHPNVVAVYDQGNHEGTAFLVMEYVPGSTLREVLNERGRLSVAESVDVLEPVLEALAAAHRAGVVHRDVKPENVLLGPDGVVKVADFGLARGADSPAGDAPGQGGSLTRGLLLGTVAYIAPEQVTSGHADPRSDVYAAGTMLFEMITGSVPFSGEQPAQVMYQHVHSDVPPPSSRVPGLPMELDELVLRATRRDPGARPADAGAFLAELSDLREDLGLTHGAVPIAVAGASGGVPQPYASSPPPTSPTTVEPRYPPGADPTTMSVALPAGATTVAPQVGGNPWRGSAVAPPTAPRQDDDQYYGPPPPQRPRWWTRPAPVAGVLLLVLALVGGGLGWYLAVGRDTSAPGVLNKSEAEAKKKLTEVGLEMTVAGKEYSETVPAGRVTRQDPKPNQRVEQGGTVKVWLSQGRERFEVPDVAGKSREDAEKAIKEAHLKPVVEERFNPDVEAGKVIGTRPKTGTAVKRDTQVTIELSQGPPPIDVPNLTGKTRAEAENTLKGLGFQVQITEQDTPGIPPGTVVQQNPSGGKLSPGQPVTLVVTPGASAMPNEVGKPAAQAEQELRALGLNPQIQAFPGGPGNVVNQNPPPGTPITPGQVVQLFVF
jgi:beta-lactam-binding protein with PASTA domain/serine/threonine protein kinase